MFLLEVTLFCGDLEKALLHAYNPEKDFQLGTCFAPQISYFFENDELDYVKVGEKKFNLIDCKRHLVKYLQTFKGFENISKNELVSLTFSINCNYIEFIKIKTSEFEEEKVNND